MRKNIFSIAAISLSLIAFSSCSNEEQTTSNTNAEQHEITVSAGIDNNGSQKVPEKLIYNDDTHKIGITWSDDDAIQLAYYNGTSYQYTSSALTASSVSGQTASFKGSISSDLIDGKSVYGVYPNNSNAIISSYYSYSYDEYQAKVTLKLGSQNGNIENLKDYDFMTANQTYTKGTDISFDFAHRVIFLRMKLKFKGITSASTISNLSIKGLSNTQELNLSTGYTTNTAGTISVNPAEGKALNVAADGSTTIYVAVFPEAMSSEANLSAIVNGTTYKSTLSKQDLSSYVGKVITVQSTLKPQTPTTYYYADGTTGTSSENAIGVVFWTGNPKTDATYGDAALKDECSHGFVVALKDLYSFGSTFKWRSYTSSSYSVNSTVCGYANCQPYLSTSYPAVYNASKYTPTAPAASSGWFLPSQEQFKLMLNLDPSILNLLSSTNYWTSTIKSTSDGTLPCYYNSSIGFDYVSSTKANHVRPILAF